MGYFTNQFYNQPMVNYVDPRLDVLANSAAAIQKRHDDNYAKMNAMQIMANNIKVSERDRNIKEEALNKLNEQIKAISDSGDYALATPRIGQATKDFMTNQTLLLSQDNEVKRQKDLERLATLGGSGFNFNKDIENWSTIDPTTGKPRQYVSKIEEKMDWDKRAQEVSHLIADTTLTPLQQSQINGYLQSGSTTGITDTKVLNYLEDAVGRFKRTKEGDQMYRVLTEIEGKSPEQAKTEIVNFIHSVGKAQIHTKQNRDYQYDQVAAREDGQVHDEYMENLRYKKAMDAAKAKAEEEAKAQRTVLSPTAAFELAASTPNADGSYGTTMTTQDVIDRGGTKTEITDPETGSKFDAVYVPMEVATFGTKFTPEAGNFPHKEVETAKEYFSKRTELDKAKEELARLQDRTKRNPSNRELEELPYKITQAKEKVEKFEKGYTSRDLENISQYGRLMGKSEAQIAEDRESFITKSRNESLAKFSPKDITVANKYTSALANDNIKYAESVGQKLNGWKVPAIVDNSNPTSAFRVDGNIYGNFVAKLTGKQLKEKLSSNEIEWMRKTEAIKGNATNTTGGLDDESYYDVHFSSKLPSGRTIANLNNNAKLGVTEVAKNYAAYTQNEAETNSRLADLDTKMNYLTSNPEVVIDRNSGTKASYRQALRMRIHNEIDNSKEGSKEQKAQIKQTVDTYLNDFDNLSIPEKTKFIQYLQENNI